MSISISNNYINNTGTNVSTTSAQSDGSYAVANGSGRELVNVKSGQTIQGEVVSRDGNTVTLKLADGQMVNARLSGDASILPGKLLSFEVQNPESGSISLRPLFSNLSNTSSVGLALSAAFLEPTETYIKMTSAMMDAGMSIDKNSLLSMARNVNSFPLADPSSIVQMVKLGLPIDELNVTQYENYRNFEHQIINDVNEMAEGLTESLIGEISNGNDENFGGLSEILSVVDTSLVENYEENTSVTSQEIGVEESIEENNENSEVKQNAISALKNAADALMEAIRGSKTGELVDELSQETAINQGKTEENAEEINENVIDKKTILNSLSEATGLKIPDSSDTAGTIEFLKKAVAISNDPNISDEARNLIKTDLKELLIKEDIKSKLTDAFKAQLTLRPERVAKEGEVSDLFSRIMKFSQKVIDISGNNESMSNIAQNAHNLQDNVNFMNNLNHLVNYVQLPLKMYQENAHGELYVYSKHKSLQETDGNLNALLHLDMENLGPMDVYVAMKNYTNVTTNFRLANEEILDFVEENIHILEKALSDKGYNMTTNVTTTGSITGEEAPITDEFFKNSPEDGIKVVSKLQFDVRA